MARWIRALDKRFQLVDWRGPSFQVHGEAFDHVMAGLAEELGRPLTDEERAFFYGVFSLGWAVCRRWEISRRVESS